MAEKHEYKCKLECLSLEAEKAIENLLSYYSLESNIAKTNNLTDADEAFTAIISSCHQNNQLKKVKKLSFPDYQKKCFDLPQNVVKNKIYIKELDITISFDILWNIDVFPTCKDHYKSNKKCKNLAMAGNHTRICCVTCMTCSNCSQPCVNAMIKDAVVFIKEARNFTAHVTFAECKAIENNVFACITLPNCSSWEKLLTEFTKAIKCIFELLKTWNYISDREYKLHCNNLDTIVCHESWFYMQLYVSSMRRMEQENVIIRVCEEIKKRTFTFDLNCKESELRGLWGYICRLFSRYLQTPSLNNLDIDDPSLRKLLTAYHKPMENFLIQELKSAGCCKFDVLFVSVIKIPTIDASLGIRATINIGFDTELPDCYKVSTSQESVELRSDIKSIFQKAVSTT